MESRVGPYQVEREIGRGGMGVVYLARDSRLDRAVAIKTLPEAFASDPSRLERFEREARTLAQLNHPNIGQIYGVEEQGGRKYLVLEYVEGETLADRLHRGPLPVDDAIEIAVEIAKGLEAAHDAGVIHRDLKPTNIKLTPTGRVKVLDFGLAKADEGHSSPGSGVSQSPTLTSPQPRHSPTIPGAILGTAAYMSPEQARGRSVDKRSDIWSFGVILYEMLIGGSPFAGETVSDSIGAVLHKGIDLDRLPAETSVARRVLHRCLQRERDRRYHDIADARLDLEEIVAQPTVPDTGAATTARPRRDAALVVTGLLVGAGAAVAAGAFWFRMAEAPAPAGSPAVPVEFDVDTSALGTISLPEESNDLAISAAGDLIAVEVSAADGPRIGIRTMGGTDLRPVETGGVAWGPFFSPDGRWLAYFTNDALMKVPLAGGPATTICRTAQAMGPAAWLPDGRIVFAAREPVSAIVVVEPGADTTRLLAPTDRERRVEGREPFVSGFHGVCAAPDGDAVYAGSWDGETLEDMNIVRVDLSSGAVTHVISGGGHPMVLGNDTLVFLRESTLFAARVDPRTGRTTGEPWAVHSGVRAGSWADLGQYALSPDGTLAFVPGGRVAEQRRIVRVDRAGNARPLGSANSFAGSISVAPNGKSLAIVTLDRKAEIWLYDIEGRAASLVSGVDESYTPVFSPDSRSIVFQRIGSRTDPAIFVKPIDSAAEPRLLVSERDGLKPRSWSPDGSLILLSASTGSDTGTDLLVLNVVSAEVTPLLATSSDEAFGSFSPNGNLFAFVSDESRSNNVYVARFPPDGRRWRVSDEAGGSMPRWSVDGEELFFLTPAGALRAAAIETDDAGEVRIAAPTTLFSVDDVASSAAWGVYDVTPDGDFIMLEPPPWERESQRFRVITHFDRRVDQRMPR